MNSHDATVNADAFPPAPTDPPFEVGDIFREYGPAYRAAHKLTPEQHKALTDIAKCRTKEPGGHLDRCDHCDHERNSYNSCRNRNCPKCRASQRSAWVDARELELLPIQYFHIVFTLPDALLALTRYNRLLLYNLLLRTAAETLQTFAKNRWDGRLGIIMVLHTWGQTLNDHPHVHCIVTGGVLKNDGSRFIRAPKNFLFPMRLPAEEFIRRFLGHVLPARFHRIRFYGFLVNSQREQCLIDCRRLLALPDPEKPFIADIDDYLARQGIEPTLCPKCGIGHLHPVAVIPPQHDPPLFFLEAA